MNQWRISVSCCFILTLATDISHAAGMIARVQQMKAQKQGQMTQEQAAQYQAYQQQQAQAQGQQAAPAPPTYQQTVDQRNQAIAQAILNAHNPSVSSEVPFGNSTELDEPQQQSVYSSPVGQQQQTASQPSSGNAEQVVDLSEVWKKLDTKSTVWPLLMDDQAKVLTVSEYIDRFHQQGVKINGQPEHYAQMIDQIVAQSPQMLQRPFGELLQIAAIVDYDFDNGMDKDELARKILGEAGYEANKRRFTQQGAAQ